MRIVPGEYVFTCGECDGDGELQVISANGNLVGDTCFECDGDGVISVDEDEARELIEDGSWSPLRAPAGFSEDED